MTKMLKLNKLYNFIKLILFVFSPHKNSRYLMFINDLDYKNVHFKIIKSLFYLRKTEIISNAFLFSIKCSNTILPLYMFCIIFLSDIFLNFCIFFLLLNTTIILIDILTRDFNTAFDRLPSQNIKSTITVIISSKIRMGNIRIRYGSE